MKSIFDMPVISIDYSFRFACEFKQRACDVLKLTGRATFILSLTLLSAFHVIGQINIDQTMTPEELVQEVLLGEGIEVSNVTFNGLPGNQLNNQIGFYEGSSNLVDFDEGVIMVSGNVIQASGGFGPGPNPNITGDPDLFTLANPGGTSFSVNNCAILEFDFIPTGDSLSIRFVFTSHEYPSFTCTQYNDPFGFFISGPGINGDFTNDAMNIALVPNSDNIPIAVNTINGGVPTGGGTVQNCLNSNPNYVEDSQYFVNNSPMQVGDVQFPGMTVTLVAHAQVICGETYHIKLAIADASDQALDSGVFLEKGGFTSNLIVDLDVNPVLPDFEIGENDFNDGLVAGCSNAQFCLFRADTVGTDTAWFELSGSALPGVHYIAPESNLVVFHPGVDSICVDIISLATGLGAQIDSLTVTAVSINACGDSVFTSASINVYNEYTFNVISPDITLSCPEDLAELFGSANSGLPPYNYEWFLPDSVTSIGTGQLINVDPPAPGETNTYLLLVMDGCGLAPEYTSVNVTNDIQPPPIVSTSPNDTINCVGQTVNISASGSQGQGDLQYEWSTGASGSSTTVGPDGTQTITWYHVTATDECGLSGQDSVAVYFIPLDNPVAFAGQDVTVICPGDEVTLTGTAEGGAAPYQFNWQGFNPGAQITVNPNATETYFLVVSDDCGGTSEMVSVDVIVPVYDPISISIPEPTSLCPGDTQTLTAVADGGAGGYQYSWDTGQTNPTINVSPDDTDIYTVTVTDICEETATESTTVTVPVYQPIDATVNSIPVCTGLSLTLSVNNVSGGAGSQASDYSYAWDGPGNFGTVSASGTVTVNNADAGIYTVLITDVCGNTFDGQVVSTLSSVGEIPNVITPNNDQINDHFVIPGSSVFSTTVVLHDRWGNVVYESENYRCDVNTKVNCWSAKDEKGDVYFYLIDIDNGLCTYQGYVHVLDNQ